MPSRIKHIEQYRKNKKLANTDLLKENEYMDWRIVVIFYAAMHYIDSSYANLMHPTTHKSRKKYLQVNSKYDEIIDDYENLEMLSRKSRYDCIKIKQRDITDALENLSTIEKFVGENFA